MTHAARRSLYGRTDTNLPSRFLDELPDEGVERERLRPTSWSSYGAPPSSQFVPPQLHELPSLSTGDAVRHHSLGTGIVTRIEPDGVVTVRFEDGTERRLMLEYAPLEKVGRMSVDVRPCADEAEFERAFMQIGQYFGSEPATASSAVRFARVMPIERMHAAWDGDDDRRRRGRAAVPAVGAGRVASRAAGTTVVGVAPTHRRRGVAARADARPPRRRRTSAASRSRRSGRRRRGSTAASATAAPRSPARSRVPREHVDFDAPRRAARAGAPRRAATRRSRRSRRCGTRSRARRPGMILRSREWWEDRALADPADRRWGGGPEALRAARAGRRAGRLRDLPPPLRLRRRLVVEQARGRRGGRRRAGRGRGGLALPARHRLDGDDHRVVRPARPSAVLPARASRGG